MKLQSSIVIAIMLGAVSAIQLNGAPAQEKTHLLEPIKSQQMSNFGNSEVPLFPEPVGIGAGRTAFYSQTGSLNGQPVDAMKNNNKSKTLPIFKGASWSEMSNNGAKDPATLLDPPKKEPKKE